MGWSRTVGGMVLSRSLEYALQGNDLNAFTY